MVAVSMAVSRIMFVSKRYEDVKEFYLGFGALSQRKSYRDVKHYKRRKRWLG